MSTAMAKAGAVPATPGAEMVKHMVVTGASSGIGLATARSLAASGAAVALVCRDSVRGAAALSEVARAATGPRPALFLADLSSQAAVRALAAELRLRLPRIDALINNAGAAFPRRGLSGDGIEKTLAVNHLAPFLLTQLLLDRLRAAPAGRVITVSSEIHSGKIDFSDLQSERRYHFLRSYALSKLANVLFTYELARRLAGTAVTANCMTPGPAATNFGRGAGGLLGLMSRAVRLFGPSPEKAASTSVFLALSAEVAGISGRYFARCREARTKPITYDAAVAKRLWDVSEALCAGSGVSVTPG